MTRPVLTVVIPCLNGRAYLESLAALLARRDRTLIHVVFVDDGSTDGSGSRFRALCDGALVIEQANAGLAAARNTGIDATDTTWIVCLDCDDMLDIDTLNNVARQLGDHAADVLCFNWRMVTIDDEGDDEGIHHEPMVTCPVPSDVFAALLAGTYWNPIHACIFRRADYLRVGGSDATLTNAQDFDLWVRLALDGARFEHVNVPLADYYRRSSAASLSRENRLRYFTDTERAVDKARRAVEGSPRDDSAFRTALATRLHHIARNVYAIDRTWHARLVKGLREIDPTFVPPGSALYSLAYRVVGPTAAEGLAAIRRKWRRQRHT